MGEDFFIGTIIPVPYSFIPEGTVLCNGQELSVNAYQALYALLGNTFGGTYPTTFRVPNLQGFEPHPSIRYVIALTGYFPTRD